MEQVESISHVKGGVSPKLLSALVALVLAIMIAPAAPSQALAADPALSVGLAAGTHQGYGKTSFDVLTGKSATLYAQIQSASMGETALVEDGFRVAEGTVDGNASDYDNFVVNWYKDSVDEANLVKTSSLGWNSYYERPQWTSDFSFSPETPEAAGTYKFYAVASWELEGYESATSEPLEFTMTVTDPVESDITGVASPQEGGSLAFKVDGEEVVKAKTGDEVTVVATAAEGYTLGEITVVDADGEEVDYSSYWESFDMPSKGVTVTATFLKVVTSDVVAADVENGTVTFKVDGEEVTQAKTGDSVRIYATPDTGYVKGAVTAVDAEGNELVIDRYNSFTMPSSKVTVTVAFTELPKHTVAKAPEMDATNGDIAFVEDTFIQGGSVELTITPAEGYELDAITFFDSDGNEISTKYFSKEYGYGLGCVVADDGLSAVVEIGNYWDSAYTDFTVNATFKKLPAGSDIELAELGAGVNRATFKVAKADGTTLDDAKKAEEGDVVTVYPVVGYGYDLDTVTVADENGQEIETTLGTLVENGGKYYFTMPAGKVVVTVTAAPMSYSVVVDEEIENGTIAIAEGSVNAFTTADFDEGDVVVKFEVEPASGYKFDEDSFKVVDEDGWGLGTWDGVTWDAETREVTFSDYVLDGSAKTFTLTGEFVEKGWEDVVDEIAAIDEAAPDADAVAEARSDFDALSADQQELVGKDNEAKLLAAELTLAKAEAEAAKADADAAKAEAEAAKADADAAKAEAEAAKADADAAKSAQAEAATAAEEAQRALEQAQGDLAAAQVEADAAKADAEEAKKAAEDAAAQVAEKQAALDEANKQLDDAKKAAEDAAAQLSEKQAALDEANKAAEAAQADADTAKKAADEAAGQIAEKQAALDEASKQLEQVKDDLAKAQEAQKAAEGGLDAANGQIASLQSDLAAAKEAAKASGKADNPMTVKANKVKAKKAKKTKIKAEKAFEVANAKGELTFAKISGNAKITVKANGKVVVKKGLKKKTYKVKVLVVDAGNNEFAPAAQTVTLKVKVK